MQLIYIVPHLRSAAYLHPIDSSTYAVTDVFIPRQQRGKGAMITLLEMITKDADDTNTTILLHLLVADGLTYGALKDWYKAHGFVEDTHLGWTRHPVQHEGGRE